MLKYLEGHKALKPPKRYSINLMWMDRTLDQRKRFLGPWQDEKGLITNFLEKAIKWKTALPDADINIWYDGKMASTAAADATHDVLNRISPSKINMYDLREIPIIRDNPDVFSDNIPIYFRVDIAKPIICLYSIENQSSECAIFSDLEVGDLREDKGRMGKDDLFNRHVLTNLGEYGIQFIGHGKRGGMIENQFFQIFNQPKIIEQMKLYVNIQLARAATALNLKDPFRTKALCELSAVAFSSITWELLPVILGAKDKKVVVKVNADDPDTPEQWVPYEPAKHGIMPFGNLYDVRAQHGWVLEGDDPSVIPPIPGPSLIILPKDSPEHVIKRNDLDTRAGGHHDENPQNLVARAPADGTDVYKFHPYDLTKKFGHEPSNPIKQPKNR